MIAEVFILLERAVKRPLPRPAPKPAPEPPQSVPKRRRTQFTIFGLMVLMFVASAGFAQLYYWNRADQGTRHEERKKDLEAQITASKSAGHTGEVKKLQEQLEKVKENDKHMADASSSRAIAILMAVALPMLMMTLLSIAYSLSRWMRPRRSRKTVASLRDGNPLD